jgi:RNase H-fold protein (predicted Holliday junction resolvase)|tara:strand:- start:2569 stop:3213 length:645 start_codon:yes stop_codon:yes gene_type:complete
MGRILGLDVSTKTIGIALFEEDGKLLELTHITPKIKPLPESKLELLFKKVDAFEKLLTRYIELDIEKVIIEEPLLNSNNVYTVGTLLKFNGMISKMVSEVLNVIPDFISSYDARAYSFPELMQIRTHNKKGEPYTEKEISKKKPVLFGNYDWTTDKKMVIWEKVADLEPQIVWEYTKNNTLKKENFDMTDSYACVRALMCRDGFWDCKQKVKTE